MTVAPTSSTRHCPTCGRPVEWTRNPSRPFCSPRCRLVDLGHWASERYRIAAEPVPDEDAPESEGGNRSTRQTP